MLSRYASIVAILLVVSAAGGLFWNGLYRDNDFVVPQAKGQDLVTLIIVFAVLAPAIWFARKDSLRARLAILGIFAYAAYSYAIYACGSRFNEFFLLYVAILSLSTYGLTVGLFRINSPAVKEAVGKRSPLKTTAVFFLFAAVLFIFIWLSEIVPATLSGTGLRTAEQFGTPTNMVHVLDLGFLLPALIISAILLLRGRAWGYVFTPVLLMKVAALGPAILSMALFMWLAGQPVELPMLIIFTAITLVAITLTCLFYTGIAKRKMEV